MRLAEIVVENYRGIGKPVRIKIDDIIVLIGNNNVGKTTILSAYEAFSSPSTQMTLQDFYQEKSENKPTITGIFENVTTGVADKWIFENSELGYSNCVIVKYVWEAPLSKGQKYSFDPQKKEFEVHGTGGFDSIFSSKIPVPLKISPFDESSVIEKTILSILTEAIKQDLKQNTSEISTFLTQIEELAQKVKNEIDEEIKESTEKIATELSKVFPEFNHVELDIKSSNLEPDKLIHNGSFIRVGTDTAVADGMVNVPLSKHGTGLQRTFLWSALKMLAETGRKVNKKEIAADKPKILLIEEPEAFLHPSAIREAREALYAIAELENWQVMTTTHSPIFIDLTKDHTTIIRIEKDSDLSRTVKTFSTENVSFNDDDRENLKMMTYCNPYINEFFFANHNILVEGETEYSVIRSLVNNKVIDSSIHVLNCLGKANIVTVAKILNHFEVPYYVLHDSDNPTTIRNGNKIKNGAWTLNYKIAAEVLNGRTGGLNVRSLVSIPNFEGEFLQGLSGGAKPYVAWRYFENADPQSDRFIKMMTDLLEVKSGTIECEYHDVSEIKSRVSKHISSSKLKDNDKWDIDFYYS